MEKKIARRRNFFGILVTSAIALTVAGCGGSSDSGSGQDTSASAGSYRGSINRILIDGQSVPVNGPTQIFGSLDATGQLRLLDRLGWARTFKISGNRFSKQTNNVGQQVGSQFCGGPEFVSGTLSGTTITGRIENRLQCDGVGRQTILVANFRIDRQGTTVARAGRGSNSGLLTATRTALQAVIR